MKPILTCKDFKSLVDTQQPLVIIDAGSGGKSKTEYENKHISGALYVDLDEDLSSKPDNPSEGGRHPLPSITKFNQLLRKLGISQNSHIVVYDNKGGANAASRLWWMLRSAGLPFVQVLSGGLQVAEDEGVTISSEPTIAVQPSEIEISGWVLPTVDLDWIAAYSTKENFLIIDVRDAYRYNGESEPIDLVAGHIPGAINIPYTENLDSKGRLLPAENLYQKYAAFAEKFDKDCIAVHCGSGVTACHTLLAWDQAGLPMPKLYTGSWSEYSRNSLPIETESKK